jgi:hypothetical protein
MHCRAVGKPLTEQAKGSNRTKSTVRVRPSRACKGCTLRAVVEHVFGAQANDMGGTLVRTIGLARAKAKIGMKNFAYNMRRLCHCVALIRTRREKRSARTQVCCASRKTTPKCAAQDQTRRNNPSADGLTRASGCVSAAVVAKTVKNRGARV